MGKALVIFVFSIAFVWTLQKFINLGGEAFNLAGVSFSWTVLALCAGAAVCYKLVRR